MEIPTLTTTHLEAPWTGSLEPLWAQAVSYGTFLPTAQKNEGLWTGVWERAAVPAPLLERVAALPGRWRLLVLSADWCGDASNTVPVLARLGELADNLDLRLLERDEHLDLMDAHLTGGRSRSIPVAIVLDEEGRERGWWGPRPAELQRWVMEEGLAMEPEDRYKRVRQWYARDKGVTTLEEVVALLEAAAE
jgi:hypothetical protein